MMPEPPTRDRMAQLLLTAVFTAIIVAPIVAIIMRR